SRLMAAVGVVPLRSPPCVPNQREFAHWEGRFTEQQPATTTRLVDVTADYRVERISIASVVCGTICPIPTWAAGQSTLPATDSPVDEACIDRVCVGTCRPRARCDHRWCVRRRRYPTICGVQRGDVVCFSWVCPGQFQDQP